MNKHCDTEFYGSIKSHADLIAEMHAGDHEGQRVISLSDQYSDLFEVENYLKDQMRGLEIELSYDVTAKEDLYFSTLNYTTYAGFLIMHPLCFEQSQRQMMDAYADNCLIGNGGHIEYLRNRMNDRFSLSKYIRGTTVEVEPRKVLVVLTGGNKLKKHCCISKIEHILNTYGKDNVLFKKHPVSYDDVYEELSEYLNGIDFADAYSDLYDLMRGSELVMTTFVSETALTARLLCKDVEHMDLWQNRDTTSFGHINYFLFSSRDPLAWANRCFASHKSGVIHPSVDTNWKEKIKNYLDYIMELRALYDGAYHMR